MPDESALRGAVEAARQASDVPGILAALAELWQASPSSATAIYLIRRYEALRDQLSLTPKSVRLLRSCTLEPVVPYLRAGGYVGGLDLQVHVGAFNAYAQELLDPASPVYADPVDVTILAVELGDISPRLAMQVADLSPAEWQAEVDRICQSYAGWLAAFRRQSDADLIVHNLTLGPWLAQGIVDPVAEQSQDRAVRLVNAALVDLASRYQGVYVLDYDALVARYGRRHWIDARKWHTVRLPLAASSLQPLALEWLRYLHPLSGRIAKVLVTDLDNTLWGGVLGEDGPDGIALGSDHPGAAFQSLQRTLLDLQRRGILLAVCSKNAADEALQVMAEHPDMLVRPSHLAASRINWLNKADNLRSIAAELNVGLESLAFLDDNPAERALIRRALPQVTVIELPADPYGYVAAVRDCPALERVALSAEDRERSGMYAANRQRAALSEGAGTLEDFYRSLEQQVVVRALDAPTRSRVAQLTQKTNQFNLTTRRYTEAEIDRWIADPAWDVLAVQVRDRFGDNGIVGVAMTRVTGDLATIDTLLLSCRVIGRTIETAMLHQIATTARKRGCRRLRGCFLPTAKNAPAAETYARHGFHPIEADGAAGWELTLDDTDIACPPWITLTLEGATS